MDIQLDLVRWPWLGPPGVHPCLEAGPHFLTHWLSLLSVHLCRRLASVGNWVLGWNPCNGRA